ncbi:cardiolipin synthase [Ferrimonas gelatinilytica]|uniref:Cardiolipin synthase A n=1 Tax=Ferrimonas gelatinilytica TaxID=1255257 RepID=A0ABP9RYH3_9GAMM
MDKVYQLMGWLSVGAYWLLVAAVSLRVVLKRRTVGVSAAWLMVIYILPLFGVGLYLLIGERNIGRARQRRSAEMADAYRQWFGQLEQSLHHHQHHLGRHAHPLHHLCFQQMGIPATLGNNPTLMQDPKTIFESLLRDIEGARHTIQMEFYIWHPGGHADEVAQALIDAAQRGVEVKLLLDAAGSRDFFKSHWPRQLKEAGVALIAALEVSPLRMFLRRMDLRQHRKIIVLDHEIAYSGSMNLVDPRFFKQKAGVGQWVDVMVRLTGPAVTALAAIHAWDWELEGGERALPELPSGETAPDPSHISDALQVIPSGPTQPERVIQKVLLLGIYHARRQITLCSPYFVPSEHLLEALITAAESGIRVELIVPDKNDSMMVDWASRSYFTELLRAGVKIYRFQGGLLHTKAVLIDDDHCLIGSVNLDMRSLHLNDEITLALDDPTFCAELQTLMGHYKGDSYALDLTIWRQRSLRKKLTEQFFYLFAPLL